MNLPAANYLPHRPPMLMVRTLQAVDETSVTCESVVDEAMLPFCNEAGELPAYMLVEIVAQTIGSWAGWHDLSRGLGVPAGMLLGCRQFSCVRESFPIGARLRTTATLLMEDNGAGSFEACIYQGDEQVAHATLTTYKSTWEQLDTLLQR